MTDTHGLERAIEHFDGNQAALAKAIQVSPQTITNWKVRGVPANRCIDIQEATDGQVTIYELLPDVFGEAPVNNAA